jgi:nicotinate-nucleotide adenylyltransferase
MRLGIFGGSFDPVHNGHLALARACQEQAALDEIWFTPTATQPLKQSGPKATDADRLEMLRLAIADEPCWRICRLEIDRGGLSYTVETLRTIRNERPADDLFLLMGADALHELPHWKQPNEVFRVATPLVVRRSGEPEPDITRLRQLCPTANAPMLIDMPAIDISSSEIRRRRKSNEAIEPFVPPPVARYIQVARLYR